jgi:hypothetical protein
VSTVDVITVELVMSWGPCDDYPESRVRDLFGDGLTPLQVCDLDIPAKDRLWLLLREEVIEARELRLLACRWAERVAPLYDSAHPEDPACRNTIAVVRRYALGEATDDELVAAEAAALAASLNAARDASGAAARNARNAWAATWAVRSAAWSAVWDARAAAWDAAWAAARVALAAARAIARDAQLADVRAVLTGRSVRSISKAQP